MRGSIRKRGKRWTVVVPLGREHDSVTGKSRLRQDYKSFATRSEAQAHLAHILGQIQNGAYTAPTKLTTSAFLEEWLRSGTWAPTTRKSYEDTIALHLTPALGFIPLIRLTPGKIQAYYTQKLAKGLSPATVHSHHRVLRTALGRAVRWGLLSRNAATLTDPPRRLRFGAVVWDEEQVRLFLAKAKRESPYYPLYLTAILTGMRQGELLGLRWEDVDLVLGEASVSQTFYRLSGSKRQGRAPEMLFKAPKTAGSRRLVALPPAVVAEVRRLHETQATNRRMLGRDYHDHGLVFCQPNGKPLHAHNVIRRDFHPLIEAAGLPRCRFHDLRHAHVTYLALAGVPMKVAQERLGHATSGFTMDVYTHTLPGQQAAAARAVEQLLLGGHPVMSIDEQNEVGAVPRTSHDGARRRQNDVDAPSGS
ncbi:MAG TPA: tyrosine-type recombinase/integrase [bacterium]|nr:tyrosine-type recombinase/integrase [bacterium]